MCAIAWSAYLNKVWTLVAQEAQQSGEDLTADAAKPRDDRFDADWHSIDGLCDQKVSCSANSCAMVCNGWHVSYMACSARCNRSRGE